MKLTSSKFDSVRECLNEKDTLRQKHSEREEREKMLRSFYNGQPIMTEESADEEDLDEITNHLIGYTNLQVVETRLYSFWTNSNKFISVKVTDGDFEAKETESEKIDKYLNRALYRGTRLGAFLRSVAGEVSISGRAACVNKENGDWCPEVQPKILLPDSVGSDISELTYAFSPKEMTIMDLKGLKDAGETAKEAQGDEEDDSPTVAVDTVVIDQLIATIEDQVEHNDNRNDASSENQDRAATNTDEAEKSNKTTVNLWHYYEIRFDEEEKRKVVDLTIMTEQFRSTDDKEGAAPQQAVVAYFPAYYDRPSEWGHLIVLDASIGGSKKFADAKGIAEITYNSDIDSEELLNRIYAGEKLRAMPRFQKGETVDESQLLGWNYKTDPLVPSGLTEWRFQTSPGGLGDPLALLRQNSASQGGGHISNSSSRGGELRTQAVERRQNSTAVANSRTSDFLKSIQVIAEEIVRRFFDVDNEPDTSASGYEQIMWFRAKMKEEGIDLARLSKSSYGFFDNIEVSVVKSSSSGENDHDLEVAERLMTHLHLLPAVLRGRIIGRYITLLTGDSDYADEIVASIPKTIAAQRSDAESEFGQIERDSQVGLDVGIAPDDVDQEHAAIHIKHMRIVVQKALNNNGGWTRSEAATFVGLQNHTELHMNRIAESKINMAEYSSLVEAFQEVVAIGDSLLQNLEVQENQEDGLDREQVEMDLKIREQARKERETAIKEADTASNIDARERRGASVDRKGDQQFLIQKHQLDLQEKNNS